MQQTNYAIDATKLAATQAIADLMRSHPVLAAALDGDHDACLAALDELDDEDHAAILFTVIGVAVEARNFRLVREMVVHHSRRLLPWTLTSDTVLGGEDDVRHIMDYCVYWRDCLAAMLEAGMPPNHTWKFQGDDTLDLVTLLCDIGDVECLTLVLDAGGSPFCHPALEESGGRGSGGLSVACGLGNTAVIELLVQRYPGITLPAETEPEAHWKALSDCCVTMAHTVASQHARFVIDELPYFMVCLIQKNRELEREAAPHALCRASPKN